MTDNKDNWRAAGGAPQAAPAINSAVLARVVGLVRGFTGFAGLVSISVLTAEAALPPSYKPPAFAAMGSDAFEEQQQILAQALAAQSTAANTADAACLIGQLVPRDSRDYG